MIDLLLSTLHATRICEWEMLLECIGDTAEYIFAYAYDNYNYARYLTPWLAKYST